jgi:polyribonucleotide nucleotidyltransferase
MDFKVAGTKEGITALQMDIKVTGITSAIMREAMAQAKEGRLFILDKMNEAINEPRTKISEYAPRFYTLNIPTDKIKDLIGPGGKVIRGIVEATGVKIDVEDSGKVNIASADAANAQKALQMIGEITATAEVGKTYLGTVVRLADFGAFVEILPGTDGLLHISEVAEHRIKDIRDELKEGDQILVKVLAVEGNRIRLSRKAILKEQRAKMEGGAAPAEGGGEAAAAAAGSPTTFEGGHEGGEEDDSQTAVGAVNTSGEHHHHDRGDRGGDRGGRGGGGGRRHHGGGGGGGRGRGGDRGGRGGRGGGGRGGDNRGNR